MKVQLLAGRHQVPANGPIDVEHLAGSDLNDNVILYFRVQHQAWQKVEVTTITGQKIASALTSWQVHV